MVQDNGIGISPAILERFRDDGVPVGIGLAGMRERVRELGGSLDIRSDVSGTLLTVILSTSHEETIKELKPTQRQAGYAPSET